MKVIRAAVSGYCMGVRRAVELAYTKASEPGPRRIHTMGPLIHNPQVLADLGSLGVEILDERHLPPDLEGAAVIIRAHGITPALEKELARRGALILDATCPRVTASQIKAKTLHDAGYRIFLAGEERHGEITGILGYAPGSVVVANRGEAEAAAEKLSRKKKTAPVALLAQTTLSQEEYRDIGAGIAVFFPGVEMVNTICGATAERQRSLEELCGKVDAVVIAGGRASANTRRLKVLAERCGKAAWLVEGPDELPPELAAYRVVGLSAGASTPEAVIDAVEEALLSL